MANIQYYIENTIHSDYSKLIFFYQMNKVSQTLGSKPVRPSLLELDGTNPRLIRYLSMDLNMPISSSSNDENKVFYTRSYKDKLLKSTHLFIYDPLGVIDEVKFYEIRKSVQNIYYLTTENIFQRQYLNFVTSDDSIFFNQSIFSNKELLFKAAMIFNSTQEIFYKLYRSDIFIQKWFQPKGYIAIKENNTEGSILYLKDNKLQNYGIFNADNIIDLEESNNSLTTSTNKYIDQLLNKALVQIENKLDFSLKSMRSDLKSISNSNLEIDRNWLLDSLEKIKIEIFQEIEDKLNKIESGSFIEAHRDIYNDDPLLMFRNETQEE